MDITLKWENYSLKDTLSGSQRSILYFQNAAGLAETGALPIFIKKNPIKTSSASILVKMLPSISKEIIL
jgi:hypothetical protein